MRNKLILLTALLSSSVLLSSYAYSQPGTISEFDNNSIKGTPGYFRVGKTTGGQWWFLTPENKPFYYKGICAVNRAGTAGGRSAVPGPYSASVDKKYNYQKNPDDFVLACFETLHFLGFNSLGAWATEEFFNKGVPFTEIIEFFKEAPFLPAAGNNKPLPDVFDPAWEIAADRKARALCSPLRYSKDLVGYFTDNEIGFGKAADIGLDPGFKPGQFDYALLRLVLGGETGKPAYEVAWDFLLKRYDGSLKKLSDSWGISIASKEDIRQLNERRTIIPGKAYNDDAQAFIEVYARRYFELANKCIRRYDPNHLILGCRFGGPPPAYVLDAIKPWTDVISANNYQPILYERYDTVYRYTGIPIIIGEFSWNTDLYKKVPYPDEPSGGLSVKERMFRRGESALKRTALHDGIVGFTWYRWVQGMSDEEKFYDGIVNYDDNPDMHASNLKMLNPDLDEIRKNNAGRWKKQPVINGEMTLFFNELKPGWNHYLRLSFKDGKPLDTFYGWRMNGRLLKFTGKNNSVFMRIEVSFDELSASNTELKVEKGVYEFMLNRSDEKFYGAFKGTLNGKPVSGKVKAYYFPAEF